MASRYRCRRYVYGRDRRSSGARRGESREGSLPHRRPHRRTGVSARRGRSRMVGRGRSNPRHDHRHQRHHPRRSCEGRPDRHARLFGHARDRAPEPAPPLPARPAAQAHAPGPRQTPLRGDREARPRRPGPGRVGPGVGRRRDRARRGEWCGGGCRVAAPFLRQPCPRGGVGRAPARKGPLRRALAPDQSRGPRVRTDGDDGTQRRSHAARGGVHGRSGEGKAGGIPAAPLPLRRRHGIARVLTRPAARPRRLGPPLPASLQRAAWLARSGSSVP